MQFKTKAGILGGLIVIMALALVLSYAFEPSRVDARSSYYAWTSAETLSGARRIELRDADGATVLISRAGDNAPWLATVQFETDAAPSAITANMDATVDYPVKASRVSDLFTALSTQGQYPLRSSQAASFANLGLSPDTCARITVRNEGGEVLLDLLLGNSDASGDIYLSTPGAAEARSGSDIFSDYLSGLGQWYDYSLFPGHDAEGLSADLVQTVKIVLPIEIDATESGEVSATGETVESSGIEINQPIYTLIKTGSGWTIQPDTLLAGGSLDEDKVISLISTILNVSASSFQGTVNTVRETYDYASVTLTTASGLSRNISIGQPNENGAAHAVVSDKPYIYNLASWAQTQILPQADTLLLQ